MPYKRFYNVILQPYIHIKNKKSDDRDWDFPEIGRGAVKKKWEQDIVQDNLRRKNAEEERLKEGVE